MMMTVVVENTIQASETQTQIQNHNLGLIYPLVCSFSCLFISSLAHLLARWLIYPLILSFARSLDRLFAHLPTPLFIWVLVCSLATGLLICWLVCSFACSVVHLLAHLPACSFPCLLIFPLHHFIYRIIPNQQSWHLKRNMASHFNPLISAPCIALHC